MSRTKSFVNFMVKGAKSRDISPDGTGSSQSYARFGDGVVRAFEIVLTPVLFALIGLGIDYKLSTTPWFTLGFFFFGIIGMIAKLWYVSFGSESFSQFLQSGDSSSKVIRRSLIKPVELGELLGGDLEVPPDLDLTLDRGAEAGNSEP